MFGFFKKLLGLPTEAEQAKAQAAEAPYKVEAMPTEVVEGEARVEAKPAPAKKAPAKKADKPAKAAPKKPAVVAKTGGRGRKPKAK
jgi:hypothetical protein